MNFARFYRSRNTEFSDILRDIIIPFLPVESYVNLRLVSLFFEGHVTNSICEGKFEFPTPKYLRIREDEFPFFCRFLDRTNFRSYSILDEDAIRMFFKVVSTKEKLYHIDSLECELMERQRSFPFEINYSQMKKFLSINFLRMIKGIREGEPNEQRYDFLEEVMEKTNIKSLQIKDKLDIFLYHECSLLEVILSNRFDSLQLSLVEPCISSKRYSFTEKDVQKLKHFFENVDTNVLRVDEFFPYLEHQVVNQQILGLQRNNRIKEIQGLNLGQATQVLDQTPLNQRSNNDAENETNRLRLERIDLGYIDFANHREVSTLKGALELIKWNLSVQKLKLAVSAVKANEVFFKMMEDILTLRNYQYEGNGKVFMLIVRVVCDSFKCNCLIVNPDMLDGISVLGNAVKNKNHVLIHFDVSAASVCANKKFKNELRSKGLLDFVNITYS